MVLIVDAVRMQTVKHMLALALINRFKEQSNLETSACLLLIIGGFLLVVTKTGAIGLPRRIQAGVSEA